VQPAAVIALDQTAPGGPTISLDPTSDTGVSSTDRITSDLTPTLRGTAEAGSMVRISDPNGVIATTTTNADGTWQVTLGTLTAGTQTLSATATDASGNQSLATQLTFVIDTAVTAPGAPDLVAGSDTGVSAIDNLTNDATPTVSGGGAEAGATVQLFGSDGVTVLGSATASVTGEWSITSTALSAGTQTLSVRQTDVAGNVSTLSASLGITLDLATSAPTVTSAPRSGDTTPVLTGSAEAGASIAILNAAGTLIGTTTANDVGAWSFGFTTPFASGLNNLGVVATDRAGNVSATVATSVTIGDASHDFNGDGRSDIFWRHENGAILTWSGQGNGGFVANGNAGAGTDWQVNGIGDFNGDGRDDVLWRNDDGSVTDWLGQANGAFASNFGTAYYQVGNAWQIEGVGDFNGDGRSDVFWRHDGGDIITWAGQGDGSLRASGNAGAGTDWHVAGVGDFNGDGRDDIVWRNDNGDVTNWLGQADGSFASNFGNAFYQVGNDWQIQGVGDFNGDGNADLLWRNVSGQVITWAGRSDGSFAANGNANAGTDWHVVQTGDFNGDGRDDVLWRNDNGDVTDWLGQEDGSFTSNFGNAFYRVDNAWVVQPPFDLF
jgi:hypothetical protein